MFVNKGTTQKVEGKKEFEEPTKKKKKLSLLHHKIKIYVRCVCYRCWL